jgi:hypothetical protein
MCAVVGHIVSIRTVSTASIPVNESSRRITSGVWQVAFTMASKPVRATKTRSPIERSCASRTSLDTASPSAISTSGATGEATRVRAATIGWIGLVDRDTVWALRCTSATPSKNVAYFAVGIRFPGSVIRKDPVDRQAMIRAMCVTLSTRRQLSTRCCECRRFGSAPRIPAARAEGKTRAARLRSA